MVVVLTGLLWMPSVAHAQDEPRFRRGLLDDEPIYKWSAPPLDEGGWVIGLSTVAYGVTDEVTLGIRASEAVLGHYNAHVRLGLGAQEQPRVSLDAAVGVLTPVAIARLFVPQWEASSLLLSAELGVPMTWTIGTGRFVTFRPWFGATVGKVEADDDQLTLLIGRPLLTGPGASVIAEGHLAKRLGVVGSLDAGLELYGGQPGLALRPKAAAVLATGPLRVNLGLGVGLKLDRDDPLRADLQPAIDVWVRL